MLRKILVVSFFSLLFIFSVHAQNTNVTATITDAGGQTWNNGTYTFNFIPKPQFNGTYRLSGAPYTPVPVTGSLSSVGAFTSVPVPDNNLITPTGTQWTVTVCAQTQFICFTSGFLTITGASQTITSSVIPPAISITCGPGVVAYADSEVNCSIGGQYYNLISLGNRQCTAVTGNACTTWTAGGSVTSGSNLPGQFNIKNPLYGAIGDAKSTTTAVTTNTSSTITDATNSPWLVSDVGHKIFCVSPQFGTSELSTTISTISAFTSASSISIAPATGNGQSGSSSKCVWFTQKETTAMLAAETAAVAALRSNRPVFGPNLASPGAVICPPGGYVVDGPFFLQNSAAQSQGVSFIGSSRSGCIIYMSPDTTSSNVAWMMNSTQNFGFTFSDFTVDCSAFNFALPVAQAFRINASGNFTIRNVELDSCGNTDNSGRIAILQSSNAIIDGLVLNASSSTLGQDPGIIIQNSSVIHLRNINTTNPSIVPLQFVGSGGQASAGGPRNGTGGGVVVENSVFDEGGNPGIISVTSGSSVNFIGIGCFAGIVTCLTVDGTSSAYITDSQFIPFNGSCGGGTRNGITIASGGLVEAMSSSIQGCGAGAAGAAVTGPAGATFYDLGGNDYRNCTGTLPCSLATLAQSFSSGVFPVFPLATGSTTQLGGRQTVSGTAPTFAVTGFGTGPTVTVGAGSTDAAGSVLITAGTTPGSSGTFTLTFSTIAGAYGTNPPVCIFGLQNGTGSWNALAQEPVIQTPTTTSVVGNWADNSVPLTAASTYGFIWSCYGK